MLLIWLAGCSDRGFTLVREEPLAPEPDVAVEPGELTFPSTAVGCVGEERVTVLNEGKAPLSVREMRLEGHDETLGDYALEGFTGDVASGGRREVVVRFAPSFVWDAAATLVVESDDPDEPKLEVPIQGASFDPTWTLDVFHQAPDPIDVLWVIDNSGSMYQERDRVTREIERFFDWFTALDLDYHMGVVTTDVVNPVYAGQLVGTPTYVTPDTPDPAGTLAAAIAVDGIEMGAEAGLQAMQMALTEPLRSGANEGFYRTGARLFVIFLTDEDDQSDTEATGYIDFLETLKDDPSRVFVAAVVGDEDRGCESECADGVQEAEPGDKYLQVAAAFGGFEESICTCDLAPALERMGFESTWYVRAFPLSRRVGSPSMLTVWVDGEVAGGWTYDVIPNAVVFDVAPPVGAKIVARYPVADPCAPR